ncbi:MAG: hypothetical protein EBX51_06600 [Acidimicrobiia bacterium]|nr:hypothetical protein [Acidimicrobiia bacterium]
MGDVGGNESHTASADTRVTHGIISLNMMKARILAVVAAATLVGGCGNVEVVAPTTLADDAIAAPDPTDDGQAEPTTTIEATTTTQPEPTTTTSTTTTVPVTTTTVLDIACIKTTACQYANLVGVDFSRLKLDFVDFSVAKMAGANFVGANLTNSIFIRTDLSAVNFEGATISLAWRSCLKIVLGSVTRSRRVWVGTNQFEPPSNTSASSRRDCETATAPFTCRTRASMPCAT